MRCWRTHGSQSSPRDARTQQHQHSPMDQDSKWGPGYPALRIGPSPALAADTGAFRVSVGVGRPSRGFILPPSLPFVPPLFSFSFSSASHFSLPVVRVLSTTRASSFFWVATWKGISGPAAPSAFALCAGIRPPCLCGVRCALPSPDCL